MKQAHAHVASAVLGLGLLSIAPVLGRDGDGPFFEQGGGQKPIRVAGIYDPKDAVRIADEYTVPEGKLLVITAIGSQAGGPVSLDIMNFWPDGLPESIRVTTTPTRPTLEIPSPGIVVTAGSRVIGGYAYGYVVDVPTYRGRAQLAEASQDNSVRIVGIPGDPREFVYIRSNPTNPNFSYRVPIGKRLMVTGLGAPRECTSLQLRESRMPLQLVELGPGELFYQLPNPGILIASGRVVNPLVDGCGAEPSSGRAFGYLIDD